MDIESIYDVYLQHPVISTDSRNVPAGCMFFALRGEHFNGNDYIPDALAQGAAYAITDDPARKNHPQCIFTEDVLNCLQQLAARHRLSFSIPFVAICGSNGKTTTKELAAAVLSSRYHVFATKGNLNNHIGVPLSLLSVTKEHEIAIIEIGANHARETYDLCRMARPTHGILTNNGKDHLEGFGSIEGVRKANAELYDYLRETGGIAFLDISQPDLVEDAAGLETFTYGFSATADVKAQNTTQGIYAAIQLENIAVQSHLAGGLNAVNLLAAASIGTYFSVPAEKIKTALENYVPSMNRSQVLEKNGITFIADAYNANPSSMELALKDFLQLPGKPKGVILGDMREMGDHSDREHTDLVHFLQSAGFDKVILVGTEFTKAAKDSGFTCFPDSGEAARWFSAQDFTGWTWLLKGSRGIRLEKIFTE